eukprot:Rmarinus@m.14300
MTSMLSRIAGLQLRRGLNLATPSIRPQYVWFSTKVRRIERLSLGGVKKDIFAPERPELVPFGFSFENEQSQAILQHLRWMMQKDELGQDIFLLGSPGPLRRWLAFHFCDILQKECEYVSISRDTTEGDLKQRREIIGGNAIYVDQPSVRAALHGRVLILDGIEKAERNILPILNNLLENREMQLEDGRFLMSPDRYDRMLSEGHTQEELRLLKLTRVDPNFRVIALGVPAPPFPGNPLDPPLRSRFQARYVPPLDSECLAELLSAEGKKVPEEKVHAVVGFGEYLKQLNISEGTRHVPELSLNGYISAVRLMSIFPNMSLRNVTDRVLPPSLEGSQQSISAGRLEAIQAFEFQKPSFWGENSSSEYTFSGFVEDDSALNFPPVPTPSQGQQVSREVFPSYRTAIASFRGNRSDENVLVPVGRNGPRQENDPGFIELPMHRTVFSALLQNHAVGRDSCILSVRGGGKSSLARAFANRLGYTPVIIHLYKDMTARDLLQRRVTDTSGDTVWEDSALVRCARRGDLAVLDGIEKLARGPLTVLQRLMHDRELDLYDGSRLVRWDRYQKLLQQGNTVESLMSKGVHPVHPAFRVIALGTPEEPKHGSSQVELNRSLAWLDEETSTMFSFHQLPCHSDQDTKSILTKLYPRVTDDQLNRLLSFSLQKVKDDEFSLSLSLRQLLRITRHLDSFGDDVSIAIEKAALLRFLPLHYREAIYQSMLDLGLRRHSDSSPTDISNRVEELDGGSLVKIGSVTFQKAVPKVPALVPDTLFFDTDQNIRVMSEIAKSLLVLKENVLLVGNQGVGKNKLIDNLLRIAGREREYVQLHRDTTVQSLTVSPTLRDGVIVWEDSPLLRAVRHGRVLVIDEADKAPLDVVGVLKGLAEDREMLLPDGRLLTDLSTSGLDDTFIRIHPDFQIVVLANRPGFPFLGNDFFRECGDIFSAHAIDNPDANSEVHMLQKYGPNVPLQTLHRLTAVFSHLRTLADDGRLAYPYSTRELVNIVRHLDKYPEDGVASTVENVLAFDSFDTQLRDQLAQIFQSHGIGVSSHPTLQGGSGSAIVLLGQERGLGDPLHCGSVCSGGSDTPSTTQPQPQPWKQKGPWRLDAVPGSAPQWRDGRLQTFTEMRGIVQVPCAGPPRSLGVTDDGSVHVLAGGQSPTVYSFSLPSVATSQPEETSQSTASACWSLDLDPFTMWGSVEPTMGVSGNQVLLYFPDGNGLLSYDPTSRRGDLVTVPRLQLVETPIKRAGSFWRQTSDSGSGSKLSVLPRNSESSLVMLHRDKSRDIALLDMKNRSCMKYSLPFTVQDLSWLDDNTWVFLDSDDQQHVGSIAGSESLLQLHPLRYDLGDILREAPRQASFPLMLQPLELKISPSTHGFGAIATATSTHAHFMLPKGSHSQEAGYDAIRTCFFGDNENGSAQIFAYPRYNSLLEEEGCMKSGRVVKSMFLPDFGLLVNAIHRPQQGSMLEVLDLHSKTLREIEVGPVSTNSVAHKGVGTEVIDMAAVQSRKDAQATLVTLHRDGCLRFWDIETKAIKSRLGEWASLVGNRALSAIPDRLRLELESNSKREATGPKHGKEDDKPHVGGNQWAGGTGGADTAGLGGKGGPYRLDKGHNVHQISDEEKKNVPPEILARAREMAKQALSERLAEIGMRQDESKVYEKLKGAVANEIGQLRVILQAVEAKAQDRVWLKHQTSGELDETKLVDGITGDKSIYRRRGEDQDRALIQPKPKRLRFVMDCSGSMYRFEGRDKRLTRSMEAAVMVMEALDGFNHKYSWSMVGHSGDGPVIPLVDYDKAPSNALERFRIAQTMYAHTQFCVSGDHTLEAAEAAIRDVSAVDADEHFVFLISDANLRRYGIRPKQLADVMTFDPKVKAYAIFIASFADEADQLKSHLPHGRSHVCLDTSNLPKAFRSIFQHSVLRDV